MGEGRILGSTRQGSSPRQWIGEVPPEVGACRVRPLTLTHTPLTLPKQEAGRSRQQEQHVRKPRGHDVWVIVRSSRVWPRGKPRSMFVECSIDLFLTPEVDIHISSHGIFVATL